jgi:MFS transporter, NNP family, nitrate/nitrite transporter
MSIHPSHGCNDKLWNVIYFYWFESMGLLVSLIAVILLIATQEIPFFVTPGGRMGQSFLLVAISLVLIHVALRFLSPTSTMKRLKRQTAMFNNKHTYIMTLLYTMSFGSFIGFSGVFPKLITDLFGYITAEGCHYTDAAAVFQQQFMDGSGSSSSITSDSGTSSSIFLKGGTEFDCLGNDGIWGSETVTNPNAPNVFAFAWIGAAVGSVIRPIGGMLADRHGGARLTQILIIWCTVATICLAILIEKTLERKDHPERNFGLFVFLFLNLFFSTGAMNGTTFRTIGVLFDAKLAGSVMGWISAIASFGAFIIPAMFGIGLSVGRPENTLYCLAAYYVLCGCINFYFYGRPNSEHQGV